MTHNITAVQTAIVRVSVQYRPTTSRHRARYVVHHRGASVPVVPGKDWDHAEGYALAAAKVLGLEPDELRTDYGFHRAYGWRWFTTSKGTPEDLPLAQRGLGVPRR